MFAFLFFGFLSLYMLLWWNLPGIPFQDLPNHVTRAYIIGELLSSAQFSELFSLNLRPTPYILGDLLLALITRFTVLERAAATWVAISFLLFPVSLGAYLKTRNMLGKKAQIVVLLSIYLATNWFFLTGYLNFCLAVSLVFLTLAVWEKLYTERRETSLGTWYTIFIVLVLGTYLMHFGPFVFLGLILAVTLVVRQARKPQALRFWILTFLPMGVLLLTRIFFAEGNTNYLKAWDFRPISEKVLGLGSMVIRFNYLFDLTLFAFFIILLLSPGMLKKRSPLSQEEQAYAMETGLISLALLVAYLILPMGVGTLFDVDERALPFVIVYGTLFLSALSQNKNVVTEDSTGSVQRCSLCLVSILLFLNFTYLGAHLRPLASRLVTYRSGLGALPRGKAVLPVATWPATGRVQVGLHDAAIYTASAHGITPYIFNSRRGEPVTYFHYRQELYAPYIFWYLRKRNVDWSRIVRDYDYLAITNPHRKERLESKLLRRVSSNRAVTIYEVLDGPASRQVE